MKKLFNIERTQRSKLTKTVLGTPLSLTQRCPRHCLPCRIEIAKQRKSQDTVPLTEQFYLR